MPASACGALILANDRKPPNGPFVKAGPEKEGGRTGVYDSSNFEIRREHHRAEPLREAQRNHLARKLRVVRWERSTRLGDRTWAAPPIAREKT